MNLKEGFRGKMFTQNNEHGSRYELRRLSMDFHISFLLANAVYLSTKANSCLQSAHDSLDGICREGPALLGLRMRSCSCVHLSSPWCEAPARHRPHRQQQRGRLEKYYNSRRGFARATRTFHGTRATRNYNVVFAAIAARRVSHVDSFHRVWRVKVATQ